jgi:DNA-binding MarR family transcriptional regulator
MSSRLSATAEARALRRLVDLVAHRSGAALSVMSEEGVTLPQVLLMDCIATLQEASISELAKISPGSAAAVSQMVDRLVRQGLLKRTEDPADRRRKAVSVSTAGVALLRELERARVADYALGLSCVSAKLRADLSRLLERAIAEIEQTRGGKSAGATP